MPTLNETKFWLQKNLPTSLFKPIYRLWLNIIRPVFSLIDKARLAKFRGESLTKFSHDGINFNIYTNTDNGTVDEEIILHRVYEPFFLSVIKKHLSPGDTFVDIGANIGQHSLFASQVVGNSGQVISFEPIPRIYEQFKKSVDVNHFKNIDVYNLGCGSKEEVLEIFSAANVGASSIIDSSRDTDKEKIKLVTADSILEKYGNVSFIKIDVEGYEYFAMQGLEKTIKKYRPKMLIEYSPFYYRLFDSSHGQKIIELLKHSDYLIYNLEDNDSLVDVEYAAKAETANLAQTNILVIPKEMVDII
jgi:FkbM family methyltransferase